MRKIQSIINSLFLTFILTPLTLIVFPMVYGVADGSGGASYLYLFGGPLKWLTVSNDSDNKQGFTDAVFNGNTGITIQWAQLLCSFLIIFVVVHVIVLIIKKIISKK
ncbi:hypothetical protein HCJ70_16450 [Listeria booriae]|uniref:hypothetical protein n=1 Tax=Listeria booriae TaxID=1552123 RepID=UPI0016282DCE|nr:hypothetical protein [Listeria booriae]MBC2100644.1 hypothetical protein [Listeria booriae]